jgi:hypothetical protein
VIVAGDPPDEGGVGHEGDVVLIGAEGAGALLDHDADDLAGEVVQAQLGAERS